MHMLLECENAASRLIEIISMFYSFAMFSHVMFYAFVIFEVTEFKW